MSEHGHELVKCSCGAVISNCRCASPNKTVRIVPNGCTNCKANTMAEAVAIGVFSESGEEE